MNYTEAISSLNRGKKVKLPEWHGYWFKEVMGGAYIESIKVFTASGDVLDTPYLEDYKNRTDWEITDGSRDFGGAIKAMKTGKLVARAGWNGKGMFIFIRPADELTAEFIIDKVKSLPQSLKDHYIKQFSFNDKENAKGKGPDSVNVSFGAYICMKAADGAIVNGWLASQTDILAEDWIVL